MNENEVSLLFPQGKELMIKNEKLTVKPFGFGKFPKVLALMKGFKQPAEGTETTVWSIAEMIGDNADAVVQFAMLATGKPKEWFDDMEMDEGVELLGAIVEVNADFFVKRLQPKTMGAIEKLTNSLGALSSPA